ncbi:hypothetical protein [Thermus sp. 2.9]|uniref:hypothetical protein n=1 Tax=Thermus sp. (strain 2.9) TaxID=1577051 RepID=UPI001F313DCA|nr:hypothetical protein [Thermus sp. 2.9]
MERLARKPRKGRFAVVRHDRAEVGKPFGQNGQKKEEKGEAQEVPVHVPPAEGEADEVKGKKAQGGGQEEEDRPGNPRRLGQEKLQEEPRVLAGSLPKCSF